MKRYQETLFVQIFILNFIMKNVRKTRKQIIDAVASRLTVALSQKTLVMNKRNG